MNTNNLPLDDAIGAIIIFCFIIVSAPLFAEYLKQAHRNK